MLFTDILKVFESAHFFLFSVNIYIICQLKGCLFIIMTIIYFMFIYNYDNHTLSPCLGSFDNMMLCMQFSHVVMCQKVQDSDVMG